MNKVDGLYKEYIELKDKISNDKSLNLKEEFKNKLIELDYAINAKYELELENNFPMTTTLEKEEERLEKLISFVESKKEEQKKLISDYKEMTGDAIELSYLKYSDNLKVYKDRLNNVKKILVIIDEIENILKSPDNKNELRLKVVKNRLMKKELLNLLYEFCLIDDLDVNEINIKKLVKTNLINEVTSLKDKEKDKELVKSIVLPKKKEKEEIKNPVKKAELKKVKVKPSQDKITKIKTEKAEKIKVVPKKVDELKKEEVKPEKVEPIEIKKEEIKLESIKPVEVKKEIFPEVKVEPKVEDTETSKEEKVLTAMPIVEKIGSVVPVNVFESLQKTEEKLPDVVLPSNGLKDDQNDIFVDTKDLFAESEKN